MDAHWGLLPILPNITQQRARGSTLLVRQVTEYLLLR
jgi:hypothetical protein